MLDGKKVVLVSILRAGNGILDGMLRILPSARVGHIGLYRDHRTLQAVEYFFKVPSDMADRDVIVLKAEAQQKADQIKGEGDAQAASIYADAFGRDPQFAQFYRSLDAYKASFNKKADVMVLDPSSSEFFKAFRGNAGPATAQPKK